MKLIKATTISSIIFILTLLCLFALPTDVTANTIDSGTCGENLTWILDDTGTLTISGAGIMDDFLYPNSPPWDSMLSSIKTVVIETGIVTVGSGAFQGCTNLTNIIISDTVLSIESNAFYGCNSLTSIYIPGNVRSIGYGSFESCSSLSSVILADGVTYIGYYAFFDCQNLSAIYLSKTIQNIGLRAFDFCSNLSVVFYGGTSNSKYNDIEFDTSELTKNQIKWHYESIDLSKNEHGIILCRSCSKFFHGDGSDAVLLNISLLTPPSKISYLVGESLDLEGISYEALFLNGGKAILGMEFIENISADLSSAGKKTVTASILDLPIEFQIYSHIGGIVNLDSSLYPESNHDYGNSIDETKVFTYSGAKSLTIAFSADTKVENYYDYLYVYDGNGKQIGKYTNTAAANLTLIIPGDTFKVRLTSDFRTTAYGYSFSSIKADMGEIIHPKLTVDEIAATCTQAGSTSGSYCSICGLVLSGMDPLAPLGHNWSSATCTKPSTCTRCGNTRGEAMGHWGEWVETVSATCLTAGYQTLDCKRCATKLTKEIPANVHHCIDGVCTICGEKIVSLDLLSYEYIAGYVTITDCAANATGILTIPETINGYTVTTIGNSAFYDCRNLQAVIIPNSVTTIGGHAFYNCDGLTSITIPGSVTKIGSYAFYCCDNISEIILPNSITAINENTFAMCENLQKITIPNSVTQIDYQAFEYCNKLTSIVIPEGVTSIGSFAFGYCRNLNTVVLPSSILQISSHFFYNCTGITNVIFCGTQTQWTSLSNNGINLPVTFHDYQNSFCTVCGSEDRTYLTLTEDTYYSWYVLSSNLYIDLNGYDFSGTILTNGYSIYGMDSSTDKYTCDNMGVFSCVDEYGDPIVPVRQFKTDISGSVKRYMAINTQDGYSFHRFYLGIQKVILRPGDIGFGYKAQFFGDEMVLSQLDSFGYKLNLSDSKTIIEKSLKGSLLEMGREYSLLLKQFDIANYGETDVNATVFLSLKDGVVIDSSTVSCSMKSMLQMVYQSLDKFSDRQIRALWNMCQNFTVLMKDWNIDKLLQY